MKTLVKKTQKKQFFLKKGCFLYYNMLLYICDIFIRLQASDRVLDAPSRDACAGRVERRETAMNFTIQRAGIWKRISAFLFDAVILFTVAIGIAAILSAIIGYDKTAEAYEKRERELADIIEAKGEYKELGITFDEPRESYKDEKLTAYDKAVKELEALRQNDGTLAGSFAFLYYKAKVIVGLAFLIAFLLLEFAVPLFFKNGRTFGKKIFGIGVVHSNGVKVRGITMFARSILMKFAVETMIPMSILIDFYFMVETGLIMVLLAFAILSTHIIIPIVTKTNSALHDGFTSTVVIDYATQMIFESEADLVEYQKKRAAKIAAEREY